MQEKIALGFGDNIDYEIVWKSRVIESLIIQYGIHDNELDAVLDGVMAIDCERDLVISILSFLKSGTGDERWVSALQRAHCAHDLS